MKRLSGLSLMAAVAVLTASCGGGDAAPKLSRGKYYTITFPKESAFTAQKAFRVVESSGGNWVRVEVYKIPGQLLGIMLLDGFGAKSGKPEAERERVKAEALAEMRKGRETRWINLNMATSIMETPDEELGALKELEE